MIYIEFNNFNNVRMIHALHYTRFAQKGIVFARCKMRVQYLDCNSSFQVNIPGLVHICESSVAYWRDHVVVT